MKPARLAIGLLALMLFLGSKASAAPKSHEALKAEHEKMEAAHKAMETAHAEMEGDHEKWKKEHDAAKGTTPDPAHDKLESEHQKLIAQQLRQRSLGETVPRHESSAHGNEDQTKGPPRIGAAADAVKHACRQRQCAVEQHGCV